MSDKNEIIDLFSAKLSKYETILQEVLSYGLLVRPDLVSESDATVISLLTKRFFNAEREFLYESPEIYEELYSEELL